MKNFIRKWLEIPTREEIYKRIDSRLQSKVDKRYNTLRKSDKQRYRTFIKKIPCNTEELLELESK